MLLITTVDDGNDLSLVVVDTELAGIEVLVVNVAPKSPFCAALRSAADPKKDLAVVGVVVLVVTAAPKSPFCAALSSAADPNKDLAVVDDAV